MSETTVRELDSEAEWRAAYPVLSQLRDLPEREYLDRLETMHEEGYHLFGLEADGELVSVAGVTVLTNLYNGRFAFLYDLVTDEAHRSGGYGAELLAWVEDWARERGCAHVSLESGLWREDAHRFYDDLGYEKWCYSFRKAL